MDILYPSMAYAEEVQADCSFVRDMQPESIYLVESVSELVLVVKYEKWEDVERLCGAHEEPAEQPSFPTPTVCS
ncbi:hypothetical protein COP1_021535 [Malus domestica]